MSNFRKIIKQYDYRFPQELIAQQPASPRDSARLLIYNRENNKITHDVYSNLPLYVPNDAVLVLNQTKVLPARIKVVKPTGGIVKLLYLAREGNLVRVLSDKKIPVGTKLNLTKTLSFSVTGKNESHYLLKPSFPTKNIHKILTNYGETPLPPYIKHTSLKGKKLLNEYNTVFAQQLGSVAAPTASLHFTKPLLNKLKKQGVAIQFVTLHVNLGTFAPLKEEQFEQQQLHSESYHIDQKTAEFLNQAKADGRPIIAVGTTVVRTLESASNHRHRLTKLSGDTRLFISEHTTLKFVNQLLTNFHVPQSSLLMLVSAFIGRKKLLSLYRTAIALKYRLFSFGDGMYIR